MRTLKYALLGLINRAPITGYDIMKEFESQVMANFWYAKHSQVYPELKRLTEEGLIEYKVVIQGEKLEKKLYSITEKGKEEFKNWLVLDEPIGSTPKDVFRLRTYFTDFMDAKDFERELEYQREEHQLKLNALTESMKAYNYECPKYGTPEFGDYSVLLCAIMRENFYIKWLNICMDNAKNSK